MRNANTKLVIAGVLLAFALTFYLFGQSLLDLDTAEAPPPDTTPTPTALLQVMSRT